MAPAPVSEAIIQNQDHLENAPDIPHNSTGAVPVRERDCDCDYDPWLLDDHPLRGYPTECGGLVLVMRNCVQAAKRNWNGRVFQVVCFLVIILVILQSLAIIPHGITYLFSGGEWGWNWTWSWREQEYSSQTQLDTQTWNARWPTEFIDRNTPTNCLSSNTGMHVDPIRFADAAGCVGAKTDIWLYNDQILVGASVRELDSQYTLQRMYLDTLMTRFEAGVSSVDREFVLLLELKTSMKTIWPHVEALLDPLRGAGYLTRLDGSRVVPGRLRVVISGRGSMDGIENVHNDVFFDGSLDEITLQDYAASFEAGRRAPSAEVYCATANFQEAIGLPRRGRFSRQQIELIRAQTQAAHQRGLRARYEGIPRGHRKLRELVWRTLVHQGADLVQMEREDDGRWRIFRWTGR